MRPRVGTSVRAARTGWLVLALVSAVAFAAGGARTRVGAAQRTAAADTRVKVTHAARSLQPGEVVELSVSTVVPMKSVDALAFEHLVPFWPDASRTHWRGLIGLDVEVAAGSREITVRTTTEDGRTESVAHALLVEPKAFAERHLRVDPRFSDPPPSARPRIEREAARLEAIFSAIGRSEAPDVPLAAPVPQPSSSPFGSRSFFNKVPRGRHNGVDFPSPAGAEIHAPGSGRVVLVDDLYFTGNTVVIDHGLGLYTLFAHLERTIAKEGLDVQRGDVVGLVGATGRATGPHLHWSVRLQSARVDPLSLLALPSRVPR